MEKAEEVQRCISGSSQQVSYQDVDWGGVHSIHGHVAMSWHLLRCGSHLGWAGWGLNACSHCDSQNGRSHGQHSEPRNSKICKSLSFLRASALGCNTCPHGELNSQHRHITILHNICSEYMFSILMHWNHQATGAWYLHIRQSVEYLSHNHAQLCCWCLYNVLEAVGRWVRAWKS